MGNEQSLESDIISLSTASVQQAEGTGSRRRIKEEGEDGDGEELKGNFLDLGLGGENTEGGSGMGAFW